MEPCTAARSQHARRGHRAPNSSMARDLRMNRAGVAEAPNSSSGGRRDARARFGAGIECEDRDSFSPRAETSRPTCFRLRPRDQHARRGRTVIPGHFRIIVAGGPTIFVFGGVRSRQNQEARRLFPFLPATGNRRPDGGILEGQFAAPALPRHNRLFGGANRSVVKSFSRDNVGRRLCARLRCVR